jgi:hypothetical protein
LNRSSKSMKETRLKSLIVLIKQFRQNLMKYSVGLLFITAAFCFLRYNFVQDCNLSLVIVEYHQILPKCWYIFIKNLFGNGRWVGLQLKIESFEHKMPLGLILSCLIGQFKYSFFKLFPVSSIYSL